MFRPFCLEANGILLPQEWCLRVSHVHLAIWEADGNDQDPAARGVAVWRRAVYGGFQCFSNLGSTKSQLIEWRFNHHTWCFNHHRIWEGHLHGEFLWNSWAPTGSCFQRAGSRSGSLVIFEKSWAGLLSFLISGLVVRTQTRSLSRWKCWKTALDSRAQSSWWEISVLVMPSCWIL